MAQDGVAAARTEPAPELAWAESQCRHAAAPFARPPTACEEKTMRLIVLVIVVAVLVVFLSRRMGPPSSRDTDDEDDIAGSGLV